jgi:hypothetical protein
MRLFGVCAVDVKGAPNLGRSVLRGTDHHSSSTVTLTCRDQAPATPRSTGRKHQCRQKIENRQRKVQPEVTFNAQHYRYLGLLIRHCVTQAAERRRRMGSPSPQHPQGAAGQTPPVVPVTCERPAGHAWCSSTPDCPPSAPRLARASGRHVHGPFAVGRVVSVPYDYFHHDHDL